MKKRILFGAMMGLIALGQVFAQIPNFDSFKSIVTGFGQGLASGIPLTAVMGSQWSDAYIGQVFPSVPPHFGVGLTTGAAFVNKDQVANLTQQFGVSLPSSLQALGIPIPAAVIDARVGGVILPFDVGFKIGFLPQFVIDMVPDFNVDYFTFGLDVRYALLQENVVLPNLSVGLGYTYVSGGVRFPVGSQIQMANVPYIGTDNNPYNDGTLTLSQPELGVSWKGSVIDLNSQISKNLLLFTPYFGIGASLAFAEAGAGFYTSVSLSRPSPSADVITGQQAVNLIKQAAQQLNVSIPDIDANGVTAVTPITGFGLRIYGGTSINLLLLRLDLKALYSVLSNTLGAELGVRLQL